MTQSNNAKVEDTVKEFILATFLPGEAPDALTDSTPLMTNGILDSIATLRLVAFLEERYRITVASHEVNVDHLNTVATISQLVRAKLKGSSA